MAKLDVTPASLAAAWKAAKPGDILVLKGSFPGLDLAERSFDTSVVIDATAATMTKLTYAKNLKGVTFQGGSWREGLRVDGGARIKVAGGVFEGPAGASTFAAIHLNWVSAVEVSGNDISKVVTGIILTGSDGFEVTGNHLHELQSDGVDLAGCRNGRVAANVIVSPSPKEGDHPDGIQILQAGAAYPVENIVIEDNVIAGRMQGIFGGNGPYRNLTVRGNRVCSGYVNGIGVGDCDGLVMADNEVSTLPGSPWQSLISYRGSTNVALQGSNLVRAHGGGLERVLSRPAAAVSVKDTAELADLRERMAAAVKALTQ